MSTNAADAGEASFGPIGAGLIAVMAMSECGIRGALRISR